MSGEGPQAAPPRQVLVTGGSSGIGAAVVRRLARHGDAVCFTYRRGRAAAEALCAELAGAVPVTPRCLPLSAGEPASVTALVAELNACPDVVVNNAGVGSATVAHEARGAAAEAEALLRINALGPLWLVQALLPAMQARGSGKLVQIASVGGGVATFAGMQLADGMSKAALAYMTRALAAACAHSGVDVFAICPGATDTPMFQASTVAPLPPAARAALLRRLPKGRLLRPAEVAELVLFVCGPHGALLHGAVLDASLGLGCRPGLLTEWSAGVPGARA